MCRYYTVLSGINICYTEPLISFRNRYRLHSKVASARKMLRNGAYFDDDDDDDDNNITMSHSYDSNLNFLQKQQHQQQEEESNQNIN